MNATGAGACNLFDDPRIAVAKDVFDLGRDTDLPLYRGFAGRRSCPLRPVVLAHRPEGQHAGPQLQIVTYTGGRNLDGGMPSVGERIRCIASGVPRK